MEFQKPTYTYRVSKVLKVVDGDTIDVLIDVGFHTYITKRLRFLGVDTWEIRGPERPQGLVAKARLEEIVANADRIYVQTVMDATGKYGRLLAWLFCEKDNIVINVNQQLLMEGHGTAM